MLSRAIFGLAMTLLLAPSVSYGNDWCHGAPSIFAEDLISLLQKEQSLKRGESDQQAVRQATNTLHAWVRANRKIGESAGISNRVLVCRLAVPNAFVTTRNEPVRVHLDLIKEIGPREDLIAAVLAHEYAHLSLNHDIKKQAIRQELRKWKHLTYRNIFQQTWDANYSAEVIHRQENYYLSAFSINHELEADDFGISLLSKAGYKPLAFHELAITMHAVDGDSNVELFPSHPGWLDRMKRGERRVTDEIYDQSARKFIADSQYESLSRLVKDWLSLLPKSGNAAYYRSMLLRQQKNTRALEAMEEAFVNDSPSFRQTDDETNAAWLWLCTALYKAKHIIESAWCGELSLRGDQALWDEFQNQTFQHRMLVGTGSAESIGYRAIRLDFIKKPDGKKLITNNSSTAADYGFSLRQVTPIWRPIRYQKCEPVGSKQCNAQEQNFNLSVRDPDDDPFYELRNTCNPPYCRITH